jgi:hypothetical protein
LESKNPEQSSMRLFNGKPRSKNPEQSSMRLFNGKPRSKNPEQSSMRLFKVKPRSKNPEQSSIDFLMRNQEAKTLRSCLFDSHSTSPWSILFLSCCCWREEWEWSRLVFVLCCF